MAGVATAGAAAAGADGWLTTILRPAGSLGEPALTRLCESLGCLAASSDMAVLDLTAATVRSPRALAGKLRPPALTFDRAGRCLLVVGATPELTAELDRAAVPVVTLAADADHRTELTVRDGRGHHYPAERMRHPLHRHG